MADQTEVQQSSLQQQRSETKQAGMPASNAAREMRGAGRFVGTRIGGHSGRRCRRRVKKGITMWEILKGFAPLVIPVGSELRTKFGG
jgi:hypothetical protein